MRARAYVCECMCARARARVKFLPQYLFYGLLRCYTVKLFIEKISK